MTAKEFLQSFYECKDNDFVINYRPYEYGHCVISIPFAEAVKMIEQDIEEFTELFQAYDIVPARENAADAVYKLWREKRLVNCKGIIQEVRGMEKKQVK